MTSVFAPANMPVWQFEMLVEAAAEGRASESELATLAEQPVAWRTVLARLVRNADDAVRQARSLGGPEREQVLNDVLADQQVLAAAWADLTGEQEPVDPRAAARQPKAPEEPGIIQLQLSWEPGRVVAWAAGPRTPTADTELVEAMLAAAGAPTSGWIKHPAIRLPSGASADAIGIPIGDILGWLVASGANLITQPSSAFDRSAAAAEDHDDEHDDGTEDHDDGDDSGALEELDAAAEAALSGALGPSVRWLGRIALWAVEQVARGSMVPLLRQKKHSRGAGENRSMYSVRWMPANVDAQLLNRFAEEAPGASLVLDTAGDPKALVRNALTGMIDAICRDAARRIELPARPPEVRAAADAADAYMACLDGTPFDAPTRVGSDTVSRIDRWARAVTNPSVRLIVQLDPPDTSEAWHLRVLAPGPGGAPISVEEAMAQPGAKPKDIEDQIVRAERIVPALLRPGGMRRGQVLLSQDEAWQIMSDTGATLASAGFDVQIPVLSRKRATASLRLNADASSPSAAGANQLANVSWSAMFDDVELSAADIARLAKEARPLIRTGGKWVAVDRADLAAAAEALEERANRTQLTGGEMLRLALGLDSVGLAGGVSVGGESWAGDILRAASTVSAEPPAGFVGELRHYQADALGWLGFLHDASLGGCLALDMGLGKTPTMLAHLLAVAGNGPSLVIAPPAVVGNWAAEAARFVPSLKVVVHHGSSRAEGHRIASMASRADIVITTYGTAVRDIDEIEKVQWSEVVLDEAQAIKNPTNETSQQLRRLHARTRVALTGTPIENGLGDLWAILDFANPGLVGPRNQFIASLSHDGTSVRVDAESAMRALNGILVFRRTKSEPIIAAELPDRIDVLDHCSMTPEQIGLYQAVVDKLITGVGGAEGEDVRQGQVLAAITALKQICNHPVAYQGDDRGLDGRSGKLERLEEIVASVFAAEERVLVFTHFAEWGIKLAAHLSERTGTRVHCYHGGLSRGVRDQIVADFQGLEGPGVLVLSLKAGGTGLNLTAASHVVLYDRWWNPAVEDQARDRAWRIGQTKKVVCHRLVCPGTVDERVEEVVAGKRRIADMVLPKSSSLADLSSDQLRTALGIDPAELLTDDGEISTLDPLEDIAAEAGNELLGDPGVDAVAVAETVELSSVGGLT
jgi:hypothetical protein